MHKHNFIKSEKEGYEVCPDCGTYHSTMLAPARELYTEYWGDDGTHRSTLEQQCENFKATDDCGISKLDRVLQFVPKRGKKFLEIGCAPGELLNSMLERNWDVYGIEPSMKYIPFIVDKARGAFITEGYFPDVCLKWGDEIFDCIVALDVVEHIEYYDVVFREIRRLLTVGGRAIIMSPIILESDNFVKQTDFIANEHAWIFTEKFLKEYLSGIFRNVEFKRWIVGHEIIILDK